MHEHAVRHERTCATQQQQNQQPLEEPFPHSQERERRGGPSSSLELVSRDTLETSGSFRASVLVRLSFQKITHRYVYMYILVQLCLVVVQKLSLSLDARAVGSPRIVPVFPFSL